MAYKPDGHSTVSPYLVVPDPGATIDFLVNALDGVELMRMADEKGRVQHAEVRLDDSVVMLGQANDGFPATPATVHVYVPDVDASYKRALEAGAESLQEPVQRGDPDRRGGVKDANGISWWLATHVGAR